MAEEIIKDTGADNANKDSSTQNNDNKSADNTNNKAADTKSADNKSADDGGVKKTIAGGAEGDKASTPATFPEQWRKELAGEDDKVFKRLERFSSPKDVVTSYLELEKKLSSAQLKPVLAKDATPEQLTEYRAAIGVPETADKYDTKLDGGLIIGDAAKPMVDEFLKYAHTKNLPNDAVKTSLEWFAQHEMQAVVNLAEDDRNFQVSSEEVMRKEWGADFQTNINAITGLLESVPGDLADVLMLGRTADGKVIGDDPRTLKLLSNWAREINPIHTVVPNTGTGAVQAIESELAGLTKQMGNSNSDYWSKDKGPALQARFRELSEAQERVKKKA